MQKDASIRLSEVFVLLCRGILGHCTAVACTSVKRDLERDLSSRKRDLLFTVKRDAQFVEIVG
jgi:hypothetical protein